MKDLTPEQLEQAKAMLSELVHDDETSALMTVVLNVLRASAIDAGFRDGPPPDIVVVAVMIALGERYGDWGPVRRAEAFRLLANDLRNDAAEIEDKPAPLTTEDVDTLWAEHTQGAKPGEGTP